ncbi:unnamed protein product [Oikopleura dioica]|uniref:Uncharacterized protein n=1 Tax=Oikopleura dioica TaxID=34765 RepID=E4XHZ1_OIKDI|nr:unnamed protein product [Oikopleura dioica]CBY30892.1 unnamed protein product [Oikopleura dioica]
MPPRVVKRLNCFAPWKWRKDFFDDDIEKVYETSYEKDLLLGTEEKEYSNESLPIIPMKIPQGRLSSPAKSCRNSIPRTTSNVDVSRTKKQKQGTELQLRKTVSFDENQLPSLRDGAPIKDVFSRISFALHRPAVQKIYDRF